MLLMRRFRLISLVMFLFVFFAVWTFWQPTSFIPSTSSHLDQLPPCPKFEIAEDILLVLKTGATEALKRLPIHFQTTLRCVPHYVIFSDYEEDIEGYHLHDVLSDVDPELREKNPDFELYRHLQDQGRAGLGTFDTAPKGDGSGGSGNPDNPGWKLDKWKFLPMIDRSLQHRPDAKWYVFIEADSYLIWSNLLEYLSQVDASKPHYIGKHMYIGEVLFAYGGAGYAISNPAMQMVSQHRAAHTRAYDEYTVTQWAGDCVLGKTLKDVGVDLFVSFPHIQGEQPSTLDHVSSKLDRTLWCFPSISYHHMLGDELRAFWQFEMDWHSKHTSLLRHRDVFTEYLLPQLQPTLDNWDNLSDQIEYSDASLAKLSDSDRNAVSQAEKEASKTSIHCQVACESKSECLQWSYSPQKCMISKAVKLGRARTGVQSGWKIDRIRAYVRTWDATCGQKDWFLP